MHHLKGLFLKHWIHGIQVMAAERVPNALGVGLGL